MLSYTQFQKGGRVSIWIGDFSSDEALDDYLNLSRGFETDFNFRINDRDMPEACVEPHAVLISQLVDGFSWSRAYAEEVIGRAQEAGITSATTMVVFLNFEYDPTLAHPNPSAPLRFLAAVSFSA